MEKIEIIYDFNGYADPGIKKVKLTRVNGYEIMIKKEGGEIMEEHRLENISSIDAGRILKLADQKDIDIEDILSFLEKFIKKGKGEKEKMTDLTNDEKRFTAEEKKVNAFLEKNPKMPYREAVLQVLDRTEPETKVEFTEEQKEDIKREKENIEKIEKYIEENPEVEYRTAVLTVLGRDELTENQKKVEEYIEKCKGQGIEVSYREAVLKVLDRSEEPKKEE